MGFVKIPTPLVSAFKDHFSGHAASYARFRPTYPESLYQFLADLVTNHAAAWDCGTGNGQAAVALSNHFRTVFATDPSVAQVNNAIAHPKVHYRVAAVEQSGLEQHSVDLVVAAQSLHWFELDRFYQEVQRVARDSAVVAVWCYQLMQIDPDIDIHIEHFYRDTVGPYWPPERKMVEDGYRSLSFPFEEIETPVFHMAMRWDLDELLSYLRTWSATQRYLSTHGSDPVKSLAVSLTPLWGDSGQRRPVQWPLSIRVGRITL